jgi:phospholipase/carboxylesterase
VNGDDARGSDLGFVHRFVPRTNSESRVTILLLHGTGGDENDLISFGQAIAPGAALLSPRGGVLENGAPRFFRRISEGRFDPAEIRARAADLGTFVRSAVVAYDLLPSAVFALGYSNGANIASSLMFLEPGILAGAMLFRPMVVFEPDSNGDLARTGVFISAGRIDAIVPRDQPGKLATMLTQRGASVALCWQVSGHNLIPGDIKDAAHWFEMQMDERAASFSLPK